MTQILATRTPSSNSGLIHQPDGDRDRQEQPATIQALVMLYLPAQALAQTPEPSDIAKLRDLIEGRLSQVYGQDIHKKITFMMKQSRTGDTASGVEIVRTNDTLSIDVTPCAPEKTIFTFVRPYKETAISDTRCAEKPYPRLQVIQE